MPKANLYVRAPIEVAPDRVLSFTANAALAGSANVYAKLSTLAGGNVVVHTANGTVFGSANAKFNTQLKVNDVVVARRLAANATWQDYRHVASVNSATVMSVTLPFSVADTGNVIRKVDYFVVNSKYGWVRAMPVRGTANVTANVRQVGGNVTLFRQDLQVGDKVVFVSNLHRETRTVTGLASNVSMNVDANVNLTGVTSVFKIIEVVWAANNLDSNTRIRHTA